MELFTELETWRYERGLHQVKQKPIAVIKHIMSEMVEALEAVHNDDFEGFIDGICDAIIYGINGLEQSGVNVDIAFSEVLKEIHSRKGYYDVTQEKFVKTITGKEYKAQLSKAIM